MGDVVAPVGATRSLGGFVVEDRYAVGDVRFQVTGRAQPDPAAIGQVTTGHGGILGDKRVLEVSTERVRGDIHPAALLLCNVALDKTGVQLDSVGDRVHAAAGAVCLVLRDGATVHGEPAGRDLTPFFGLELAAHAVAGNLCPSAARSPRVQVHGVDATAIRRSVTGDAAAVHRDLCIAENVNAAAAKCRVAVGNFAIVDDEC